ncbi:MAG: VWA domain-containing protein [Nitriliruptor sp.]|nr:MAG: VWA domain-containing protein [Nitriliruptor sp.]
MDGKVRFEHELLALESEHDVHVMFEVSVPDTPTDRARHPLRIGLALDRSGSMSGAKLETVKRCARYLAERLDDQDAIALVAFDSEVQLVSSLAAPDLSQLSPSIAALGPGGMTNLSGGWLKAIEEVGRQGDGVRRVLLLTDGLANQGVTELSQLTSVARTTSQHGISTTTIGVGDGFAEELLTGIADAGGGRGWFAESVEDIPAIFAEEFDDLVAVVAQNVSLELRPAGEVQLLEVLGDHPSVAVEGGVQVQLGDAFSGQRLRVVLRLHIPNLVSLGVQQVAELVLRYVTVGEEVVSHQASFPLLVNAVSAEEAAQAASDPEVTDEVVVLSAAQATDRARKLADEGRHEAAAHLLRETVEQLREVAPRSGAAEELLRQAKVLEVTSEELDTATYSAAMRKRLHYRSYDLKRHRRRHDGR